MYEDVEGLDKETLRMLLELGVIDDQQAALDSDMQLMQGLRYRDGPKGRHGGRVYTAANPLEHLGNSLQAYKAGKEIDELKKKQEALLEQRTQGRDAFYRAWMGRDRTRGLGPMPEYDELI